MQVEIFVIVWNKFGWNDRWLQWWFTDKYAWQQAVVLWGYNNVHLRLCSVWNVHVVYICV